jgi:hypothetical protein
MAILKLFSVSMAKWEVRHVRRGSGENCDTFPSKASVCKSKDSESCK